MRKTDVLKTSLKEHLRKCISFEEQKGTRYIWENVYFGIIIFSCLLSTKLCLRCLLNCFVWDIKGFYQSSLWNEINFRDILNVSPKLKFEKNETFFCRWSSTDNIYMNIFVLLENACTFLLAKERTWKCIVKTNSELSQNCTERQIMLFKTTVNCLFNDIWCYLVIIACFDWKIGVFNKQLQRVYCIHKWWS